METNEAFTEWSEIQMIQYQYINKCHKGGGALTDDKVPCRGEHQGAGECDAIEREA